MQVAESQSELYNRTHKSRITQFKIGDHVLLRKFRTTTNEADLGKKYQTLFHRKVYMVVGDYENGSYTLQNLSQKDLPFKSNISIIKKLQFCHEINLDPGSNEIDLEDSFGLENVSFDDHRYDFEIEKILNYAVHNGELFYKIQFKEFQKTSAEWC